MSKGNSQQEQTSSATDFLEAPQVNALLLLLLISMMDLVLELTANFSGLWDLWESFSELGFGLRSLVLNPNYSSAIYSFANFSFNGIRS